MKVLKFEIYLQTDGLKSMGGIRSTERELRKKRSPEESDNLRVIKDGIRWQRKMRSR